MHIAIIGSGNMAKGIGTRLVIGGHDVTIYDRDINKATELGKTLTLLAKDNQKVDTHLLGDPLVGDVVIAAVPYAAMASIIKAVGDQLSGKIFVDISNPVDFQTFELLTPAGSSGAEEIAKMVPQGTKVVKAFNTIFASTFISGKVSGFPLDVFIAGDDAKVKEVVMSIVKDGGLRPLDAGPLSRARGLESFMLINLTLQQSLGTQFGSAIKIVADKS